MHFRNNIVVFLLLVFAYLSSPSQSYKEDFKSLNRALLNLNSFRCEILIKIYEDYNSASPHIVQKAKVNINGNNYLSEYENRILLSTDNAKLLINKENKSIIYSNSENKKNYELYNNLNTNTDSILSTADSIIFIKKTNDYIHYTVYSSKSVIKKTDLFIDVRTFLIKKLIYYYNRKFVAKNNKVIIEYTLLDTNPAFSEDTFSESKYIKSVNKKITAIGLYAGYKVIENNN